VRILVSGAAGFLGWNITRALRQRHPDATIVGIDCLWTGVRRQPEFVDQMVVARIEDRNWRHRRAYDQVWHLASPASPRHYQMAPLATFRANVQGLLACADYVAPDGILVFPSSSEVYGDPVVSPQPESYRGLVSTTGPRACYDESKRMCETLLCDMVRERVSIRPKIARLFNVYGPGTLEEDGRAVSNFVCRGLRGEPIEVHGDGLQTRAFTFVDDVVDALMLLAHDTGSFWGPVNIGTSVETTVLAMAEHVRAATGGISRIVHVPPAVDDPRQRLPDLSLCESVLRWRATTPYAEGVRRTVDWFRRELGL
jgi:nucleoside-diphosphate-sugar epimerase